MNLSLMGFFLKRHRILLIIIALCVAAYSVMIVALWPMFIDDGMQETMESLAAAIPGFDVEAFSMSLGQYLETQWIGAYLLPLAGSVIIVLGTKALSGGVADGSLETIFSAPLKRSTYLISLFVTLFVVAGILALATVLPLAACGPLFDASLELESILLLILTSWLVLFVFGLMVAAVAAWTRGTGLTAGIAVAFIIVMLVLYFVTPQVEFLQFLEPINLLHWWGSGEIVDAGTVEVGLWVWLAVVGVAALVVSCLGFLRRDLT